MANASKPRSQRPWFRTLQTLHLWVGLIFCLPLVVLGITGSILVVDEELRGLTGDAPAMADGPMQPVSAILAAARAAAPAGTQPGFLVLPEEPGGPATVRLVAVRERGGERPQGPQQGPVGMLTIDPVSLAVVGGADPAQASGGFLRTVHLLHGNLLIRDRSGREIVGWLGVAMLVLGVSGLVLWWPRPGRWKAAFTVKAGAGGLRLHRELHGAVGIWSLLVFLIVSFSGVYLAFPQTLGVGVSSVLPARDLRAAVTVQPVKGTTAIDVDRAVALAREAMPEANLRSISLPARPDQAYRIGLAPAGQAHGAPAATVFVDPWTAAVAEVRDPAGYTVGETVIAWQRPLHAGEGLGPLWKWAVFLSGILPPLFAVTGTLMWWLKRKARRAKDAERAAALMTG